MSHFSRLTDIVTCNLSKMLAEAENVPQVLHEVIQEMREGLNGARRSVATATETEKRLEREIHEHQSQVAAWIDKAKHHLQAGKESDARLALLRKREVEDLIGGLEQQHRQAAATREHLATMHRALEARLMEALRRQQDMPVSEVSNKSPHPIDGEAVTVSSPDRQQQIEDELERLKRELGA